VKYEFWQRVSFIAPTKLLYFCVIQAWANASVEKFTSKSPDEITWTEVCRFLEAKYKKK
jgi:hypothetical protein